MRNYNEESDEGYFSEVNIQYLEKLHELHNKNRNWKYRKACS